MTLTPPLVCFAAIGLGTALAYGLAYRPEFTAGIMLGLLGGVVCPAWAALYAGVCAYQDDLDGGW